MARLAAAKLMQTMLRFIGDKVLGKEDKDTVGWLPFERAASIWSSQHRPPPCRQPLHGQVRLAARSIHGAVCFSYGGIW
jgi:hypothetical protein